MTRFILIRLLQSLITLFGILVLVFFLVRLSGDPTKLMLAPTSSPEQIAQIKHNLGLDQSVGAQFVIYLKDTASGNLGTSYFRYSSVADLIKESLPNTLKLSAPAFFLAMALALTLGVLAATRRDSIFDNGVKFLAILGQALPGFWVAIMAVLLFAVTLHWVPVAGNTSLSNYILPIGTQIFF